MGADILLSARMNGLFGLLGLLHAHGARAFLALAYFVFNRITFIQTIPFRLGMMDEQLRAVIVLHDESVSLVMIEPLDFSSRHLFTFC